MSHSKKKYWKKTENHFIVNVYLKRVKCLLAHFQKIIYNPFRFDKNKFAFTFCSQAKKQTKKRKRKDSRYFFVNLLFLIFFLTRFVLILTDIENILFMIDLFLWWSLILFNINISAVGMQMRNFKKSLAWKNTHFWGISCDLEISWDLLASILFQTVENGKHEEYESGYSLFQD
jgi:hypothetical protein